MHTCSTCMSIPRPYLLTSGGCFSFSPNIFGLTSYVRIRAYMSRRRVPNHRPVWELQTSATPPPLLLLSIESTTYLVGHNIFTSIRDRHKNINLQRTIMATEQVGVQFRNNVNHEEIYRGCTICILGKKIDAINATVLPRGTLKRNRVE